MENKQNKISENIVAYIVAVAGGITVNYFWNMYFTTPNGKTGLPELYTHIPFLVIAFVVAFFSWFIFQIVLEDARPCFRRCWEKRLLFLSLSFGGIVSYLNCLVGESTYSANTVTHDFTLFIVLSILWLISFAIFVQRYCNDNAKKAELDEQSEKLKEKQKNMSAEVLSAEKELGDTESDLEQKQAELRMVNSFLHDSKGSPWLQSKYERRIIKLNTDIYERIIKLNTDIEDLKKTKIPRLTEKRDILKNRLDEISNEINRNRNERGLPLSL